MARRTKADAQVTRHLILDAAEREFLARGVAHTRLQDVAAAAGVTRGAIYWHFQDKAELFNAMMDRATLPCEMAMEQARGGGDPMAELQALAMAPLRMLADSPQAQRVFRIAMHQTEYTEELASVQARYLEGSREFQRVLVEVIERAGAAGELAAQVQASACAVGLFALIDGLMHHWTLRPGGFDLLGCGEPAIAAYVTGLRARPTAAPSPKSPARRAPIASAS